MQINDFLVFQTKIQECDAPFSPTMHASDQVCIYCTPPLLLWAKVSISPIDWSQDT